MEWLNQIWVWVLGGFAGITVGGIVTAICAGFIKGSVSKAVSKIDVKKTQERAVEEGLKKIKGVTFKHSIQPIVESEMTKINEKAIDTIKERLDEIKAEYTMIICIFKKFAAYFDDSLVSDSKKADLRQAIAEAEEAPAYVESVALEESIREQKKKDIGENKTAVASTQGSVSIIMER